MCRTPWATYLWPGLPQILQYGSWFGLALATVFAGLLNLGLAASLLWDEMLTPGVRTGVWAAVVAVWGGSIFFTSRADRRNGTAQPADDAFAEAVDHYLKGSWFEAERVLVDRLRQYPRDVDAELMLATLLRHAGRRDEAARHLDRLERLEGSAKWEWEIRGERLRLKEMGARDDERAVEATTASHAERTPGMGEAA